MGNQAVIIAKKEANHTEATRIEQTRKWAISAQSQQNGAQNGLDSGEKPHLCLL